MTTSPPINGHKLPAMTVASQPTEPEPAEAAPESASASTLLAQAEAEAIRSKSWADVEARRIAAEAEAEAVKIKAVEEARKLKLANDKAEGRAAEEQAAREARIAESNRKREDAERAQMQAQRADQEQQEAEAATALEIEAAAIRWRQYAIFFYAVCAVVALPVQIAAFWDPKAWWLVIAPLMLEGAALVVTKGAAAAVAAQRPHWHYRTVAWLFAFIAAGINLWHGVHAFDPATAIGTAFASLAGPGVWDLHEHGRIRRRDGVLSRKERRAAKKAAEAEAKQKAVEEAQRAEEKAAKEKAVAEAVERLADARAEEFPDVWDEAEKIAAAVGEITVTEAVWARAYRNIQGCDPGESIESITARRKAEKRVQSALTGTPVNTPNGTKNAQRAAQMPTGPNRVLKARATRRPGDTPKYATAARKQAAITAKKAALEESK